MQTFLLSILTNRGLWGFLGATAVAAAIWMIGPLLSIADIRPFELKQNCIVFIAVVYLIWAKIHILPRLYNRRLNSKLMGNLKETLQINDSHKCLNSDLADRFEEAAQMLKKAYFSKAGHKHKQWLQRFGTQYIYELPWYVIIGASGSGKTTALANSGLQFPQVDSFGKTAQRGIGGTRNCDWWFTNEAVLLDTAGRYTTQENGQAQDTDEWLKFICLLRKYRRRRPINGVVVTVSVSDLLTQSTEASRQQAVNLRQRLSELHAQLGIRFPVYVLVTKVDLLKGFRAWFANYDKSQRDQIWGVTFPRDQQVDFDLMDSFVQEFVLLKQRLEAGLQNTMLQEHDAKKRAEAWLFPQEFAALRPLLADYLNTIFARSKFETEFSPRGVYFASSTQEGQPFDQVMDKLNRELSLPQSSENDNRDSEINEAPPIPSDKGQSYFIKNLLQNVIFQDAGIAERSQWCPLRNGATIWLVYTVLAVFLVVFGTLVLTSYAKNKVYLQEVSAKVPLVDQHSKAIQNISQRNLLTMLPLLNELQGLPKTVHFDVNDPPIARRMGLYRGYDISDASQELYQKALQQTLLPYVSMRISTWLRNDGGGDAEYSYEALKAYLMLYQPKQYDGKFLLSWVMLNLQRSLPQNTTQVQLSQLEEHLFQLLVPQYQSSPYAKDEALITRERAQINLQPLSTRIYGRLKRRLQHDNNLKPLSLVTLGGPQSELVFSRKSSLPIVDGVPGLYTSDGYWLVFNKAIDSVTSTMHDDDGWVLGATAVQEDKQQTDHSVRLLYMRDFVACWDHFLADIQLNNGGALPLRINTARLLSDSNSPLRRLVISLSQELDLARAEPEIAKRENRTKQGNLATSMLDALFYHDDVRSTKGGAIPQTIEQQVTEHYAPLIKLAQPLKKSGKAIVFDDFLKEIDGLYRYLSTVQDATNSGLQPPVSDAISRLQASARYLPDWLQTMFSKMAVGASSNILHWELDNVRKKLNVEVSRFCRQAIAGRYPLVRNARNEVAPGDLAHMFAPGTGMMDTFFRDNLANKVDTTQTNWRFMPGIDGKSLPGSEGILRPFQQAQSIRDAFFSSDSTIPSFKVMVRTISMDNQILNLMLDIDGQQLRYSHGPQVMQVMNWPGPGGGNQVRMQLELADGTTSMLVTSGFWALNHFFEKARTTLGSSSLSRQATFNIDGHQVTLEFAPNSIRNPFHLSRFSCP